MLRAGLSKDGGADCMKRNEPLLDGSSCFFVGLRVMG